MEERLRFLFGTIPPPVERDDPRQWPGLLLDDRPESGDTISGMLLRVAIAARLLGADPTGTWVEARRMLAAGSERHAVMDALVAEVAPLLDAAYEACVELVRASVVVEGPELEIALRERLALDEGDPVADSVVRDALERHLLDPGSEVAGVPSGAVVHVPTLLADCVLTHHLSDAEEAQGRLAMDPDLAAFGRIAEPRTAAGPLTVELDAGGDMTWTGPAGWLPRPAAGEVLTLRSEDGQIVPATAPGALPTPPALVTALRAVYDGQLSDPPLPLAGDLLLLGLLAADRSAFGVPVAPLAELAAAAGLEQRGREFGHGDAAWIAAERIARDHRLSRRLDDDQVQRAEAVLDLVAAGAPTDADLRTVLGLMDDGDVLLAVVTELLPEDDEAGVAAAVQLGDRFVAAAGSSARAAVAHTFASMAVERAGRLADAESHLRAAAAVGEWWLVDERLAWYASDRGRAAEALGHLHDAGLNEIARAGRGAAALRGAGGGARPQRAVLVRVGPQVQAVPPRPVADGARWPSGCRGWSTRPSCSWTAAVARSTCWSTGSPRCWPAGTATRKRCSRTRCWPTSRWWRAAGWPGSWPSAARCSRRTRRSWPRRGRPCRGGCSRWSGSATAPA